MLSVCIITHAVAAGYLLRHSQAKLKQKPNYSIAGLTQTQDKSQKASLCWRHNWHLFGGMTIPYFVLSRGWFGFFSYENSNPVNGELVCVILGFGLLTQWGTFQNNINLTEKALLVTQDARQVLKPYLQGQGTIFILLKSWAVTSIGSIL